MDRSVTVYAWLFDPIDAGPFGRHCLISCQREDEIIQARISRQAPKEVAERAYRDSMVEALSKYLLSGKYTPDALDQASN
ncbi:hypothetical protein V8E54_014149 [Elaphomyces granulatus]|jgi:hypothetical protein